jgi:hypothetical protein
VSRIENVVLDVSLNHAQLAVCIRLYPSNRTDINAIAYAILRYEALNVSKETTLHRPVVAILRRVKVSLPLGTAGGLGAGD